MTVTELPRLTPVTLVGVVLPLLLLLSRKGALILWSSMASTLVQREPLQLDLRLHVACHTSHMKKSLVFPVVS